MLSVQKIDHPWPLETLVSSIPVPDVQINRVSVWHVLLSLNVVDGEMARRDARVLQDDNRDTSALTCS